MWLLNETKNDKLNIAVFMDVFISCFMVIQQYNISKEIATFI